MFDFNVFRKSINDLAGKIAQLRSEIETAKQRREDLQTLPVPKSELADNLCNWIDLQANDHRERMRRETLDWVVQNPDKILKGDDYVSLLCNQHGSANAVHQPALLLLLGDQIKAALRNMIDGLDYPDEVGPLHAERVAEIERLDTEIVKLERQEAELISQADNAGISITQLAQPRRKGE